MKKIMLIGAFSLLMATDCYKPSVSDIQAANKKMLDPTKCFIVHDIGTYGSITTKTAGSKFYIAVEKKPFCAVEDVNITIVDVDTNKTIAETEDRFIPNVGLVSFNIDNTYRDLRVKIDYSRYKTVKVTCEPTLPTTNTECFELVKTHVTEYSVDNFAVIPYKINVNVKSGFTGSPLKVSGAATNKDSRVVTNYSRTSSDLNIKLDSDTKFSYLFNISNGKIESNSYIKLFSKDKTKLIIVDKEYANVDSDDTLDYNTLTGSYCRYIVGESNYFNVNSRTKNWSGTGTNEKENDPIKNSVNVNIKQNTIKDEKYKTMEW